MVKERVTTLYICEFCQKEYPDVKDAEKCESICRRFAESPGIEILNLSPRSFNALYLANICMIRELSQHTEKELLRIKGLVQNCLNELKSKFAEWENGNEMFMPNENGQNPKSRYPKSGSLLG